jgi:orotidine-5'-phosphate decarboxylase
MNAVDPAIRDRLALALDVDDLVEAMRIARLLRPWFGIAKIGIELYYASGPEAIGALRSLGYSVFCDLKLHDIPTTVHRAARVLGALGVDIVNLHASGGEVMLRAGVDGLAEGAAAAGVGSPKAIAVTILTSEADRSPAVLDERVAAAVEAECDGVVCSFVDLPAVKRLAPRLLTVVPGIRPEGTPAHDQATPVTPRRAVDAGADILVVGRAVTAAPDAPAAAAALAASLV